MKNTESRAIPLTITLGSLLLFFCLVLTVLWNFILIYNYSQMKELSGPLKDYSGYFQWVILGIGCFLFVVVITGVILFMVFLAKQIMLNQMQKNFIDSMTHELKTPLTSLKLYTETLKKHELNREKSISFFNIMLKDIERLDLLVNQVLDASRLELNSKKSITYSDIDLEKLIKTCCDSIMRKYSLEDYNIYCNCAIKTKVYSDSESLKLLIMNLIDNAVKYSNEVVNVTVDADIKDGIIEIIVKDSGIGISKKEIKKIFRRFYRVYDESTYGKKGNGLGLFIVKQTVDNLDGKIEVISEGLNKGTTFRVLIPEAKQK
ncbi:MAG: sensor histidine kinase [Candidatus Sericytochromatia bacterium]